MFYMCFKETISVFCPLNYGLNATDLFHNFSIPIIIKGFPDLEHAKFNYQFLTFQFKH